MTSPSPSSSPPAAAANVGDVYASAIQARKEEARVHLRGLEERRKNFERACERGLLTPEEIAHVVSQLSPPPLHAVPFVPPSNLRALVLSSMYGRGAIVTSSPKADVPPPSPRQPTVAAAATAADQQPQPQPRRRRHHRNHNRSSAKQPPSSTTTPQQPQLPPQQQPQQPPQPPQKPRRRYYHRRQRNNNLNKPAAAAAAETSTSAETPTTQ